MPNWRATDRQCRKLPSTTSVEDGALVEPLAVALHGVALSGLTAGTRVLVMGAGPIGLGVAFWARRRGAAKVAVLDLTALQSELAQTMGATSFVTADARCHRKGERSARWCSGHRIRVRRPARIIAQALEHLRPRGTIVMLGLCTAAG